MRIFGVAAFLSVCVLIGCAVWYHGVTSGNGPDHSVDLRPLAPILAGAVTLGLIWLGAAIAWIAGLAARQRDAEALDQRVIATVAPHLSVRSVRLVGSRAEGRATPRSDWDFLIDTDDFPTVAADLPALCAPLDPIAQQWDPLSSCWCWMLILHGPTKIDLIFAKQPHRPEPPWEPTRDNLPAIDRHFWDWMLWLGGKEVSGAQDIIVSELEKLFRHLLAPLGVGQRPASVAAAVAAYRDARGRAERRFGLQVPRELESEVASTLSL